MSSVLQVPPAAAELAIAHFAGRLAYETDPSDVAADIGAGLTGWVLAPHPRAANAPSHRSHREIAARAADVVPAGTSVVTYCWGPGCNGGTRAALEFAKLGYPVKEMIGGFEYWAREGLPVETSAGTTRRAIDTLVAPRDVACAC